MNIHMRDVPEYVVEQLESEAKTKRMSRQQLLLAILEERYVEHPIVVGWIQVDRAGELEPDDDCPECGQPFDGLPWIGMMSNGSIIGPVCGICATSE